MIYVIVMVFLLFILGMIEYRIHCHNLSKIPTIIHVNGTRGKSTTTRLIAGGLRACGLRVIAKTTGTTPRLILEDESEVPIKRRGMPNIQENLRVIANAAKRKVDVLVIECMALSPEMQWVAETKMLKCHIGVITNIREDHLDVMGPTLEDAARAMALTIPYKGSLVTPESRFANLLMNKAIRLQTSMHFVDPEQIEDNLLNHFAYTNFKENLACALKVCELMKVNKELAVTGMLQTRPDPGVSSLLQISIGQRQLVLVNAFAANDRNSTLATWTTTKNDSNWAGYSIIGVFNNRIDRSLRTLELCELLDGAIYLDKLFLVGEWSFVLKRAVRKAIGNEKIIDLSGRKRVADIIETMLANSNGNLLILGFGNTKGVGRSIIEYFWENGDQISVNRSS